jgi:hypothetical protein
LQFTGRELLHFVALLALTSSGLLSTLVTALATWRLLTAALSTLTATGLLTIALTARSLLTTLSATLLTTLSILLFVSHCSLHL